MDELESVFPEESCSEITIKEEPLDSPEYLIEDQNPPVLPAIEFAAVKQEEDIGDEGEMLNSQEELDPLASVANAPPQVETNQSKRNFILIKVNGNDSKWKSILKSKRNFNLTSYKGIAEMRQLNKERVAHYRSLETEEQYGERLRRDRERKMRQRLVERSIKKIYQERLRKDRERATQKRAQLTTQKRIEKMKKDRENKRLKRLESKVKSAIGTTVQGSFYAEEGKYVCDICKLVVDSEEVFKKHYLMHFHTDKFCCNYCGEKFFYFYDLVEHELVHTDGKRPFKCEQCHSEHTSLGTLWQHCVKKHKKVPTDLSYKCEFCEQIFSCSRSYKTHCQIHAKILKVEDKTLNQSDGEVLNIEGKTLPPSDGETLNVEGKALHQNDVEILNIKDKTLHQSNEEILDIKDKTHHQNHREIFNIKDQLLCDVCGKMITTSRSFRNHQRIHTGEKPFVCDECGRCFTTKLTLHFHRRVHTGFRPYKCNECGKTYAQKSPLVAHLRMHSGERPFECPLCGTGCLTSSNLGRHMRRCHLKLEK